MYITTKLRTNSIIIVIAMFVILCAAFLGLQIIGNSIDELTQKTTPYQLKAIQVQKMLQLHTTNLISLTSATSLQQYDIHVKSVNESLDQVEKSYQSLNQLKNQKTDTLVDIRLITQKVITIIHQKILAEQDTRAAIPLIHIKSEDCSNKMNA